MSRGILLMAALAFSACPSGNKCVTNADCKGGEICSVMSGTCVTGTAGGIGGGGGTGGSGGGGAGGGGGGNTGGGGGATGGSGGGGSIMANGGDTCETATEITAGTVTGTTVGGVDSYSPGCTGELTPGPDNVFKISVPAGQRLTATATPEQATSGNQYDLALYLIEAPAANCTAADAGMGCLAASDDPDVLNTAESASYFNGGSAPVDVFIIIDSIFDSMTSLPDGGIGIAQEGNFSLVTRLVAPAPGDRCDTAQALTSGTPLTNQNLANFGDDYLGAGAGCDGSNASDATYSITVPAGQLLTLNVTPDMDFDPIISITDGAAACDVTCLDSVDQGVPGEAESLVYKNTTGAAQTIFVVIDGFRGSSGTFTIAATLATPPADDTCAMPTALTSGTALTAQPLTNYTSDYSPGVTGCVFGLAADRVYSIAVPNGQRLTVTATPGVDDDVALNVVDGAANCGTACLANADEGAEGDVETLTFTNNSGSAKTYLVVVDFFSGATGPFDLVATVAPPPAGDVCEMPTVLTAGTPVAGTTVGYTNDYQNGTGTVGCSTTGFSSLDRVYQVSIPANQRGLVTVTPAADAGYNPSINLVEGAASVCSAMPRTCAAGTNVAGTDAAEKLAVFNTTGAARTFFAIVDSSFGAADFNIGYTVGAPGANDTCTTNNVTLTAGTRGTENLTGFENDYSFGAGCRGYRGPDRVYRVALAANEKFTGTVTPTTPDAGFDPVIEFIPGPAANCEATPRTCRSFADTTRRNVAEVGAFTNNSGAALDLFVVVADMESDSTNRDFSLVTAIAPAAAGETCLVPRVTTAGMVTGETTMGATADVVFAPMATGCEPTTSADRVYSVSVGAGQTLTVVATPGANDDVVLNVIDGAAATCNNVTMCAASADVGARGGAETVTFMNSTAAAKVVFVHVAAFSSAATISYSLNVTVQ